MGSNSYPGIPPLNFDFDLCDLFGISDCGLQVLKKVLRSPHGCRSQDREVSLRAFSFYACREGTLEGELSLLDMGMCQESSLAAHKP